MGATFVGKLNQNCARNDEADPIGYKSSIAQMLLQKSHKELVFWKNINTSFAKQKEQHIWQENYVHDMHDL